MDLIECGKLSGTSLRLIYLRQHLSSPFAVEQTNAEAADSESVFVDKFQCKSRNGGF